MATTFGAVKQAGGCIEVDSELGKGTIFKIYLPRFEGEAERLEQDTRIAEMPEGSETVLLVEDEELVLNLGRNILKRLGYKVLPATNGGEALLRAEKFEDRIDLLITDVVMPEMNGKELATRLKAIRPEMKTLFTSGYAESIDFYQGVVDSGLHFLSKPYTPSGLAIAVRKALAGD